MKIDCIVFNSWYTG